MYFYANQQNFESMQFQFRSMPFGGCGGPSLPQICMPQPQVCPPLGRNYLAESKFFWNQCMQAQQNLFQGWQQFCGCNNNSGPQWGGCGQSQPQQPQWGNCEQPQWQQPQWGNCEQPQWQQPQWGNCEQPQWQQPQWGNCQPPEIHVHHHYVQEECPQPAPPAPQPQPAPLPQPTPQAASPLPAPAPLTLTMPALPTPTAQVTATALPTPNPPQRRPYTDFSEITGPRVMGHSPMRQRSPYEKQATLFG